MYLVNIKFRKIEVSNFTPKDGPEVKIHFNDGKDKFMTKILADSKPEALSEEVFKDARMLAKKQNRAWDTDDVLNDVIVVRIENEDDVLKRMASFFSRLQEKAKYIKGSRQVSGYLFAVENYKTLKLDF